MARRVGVWVGREVLPRWRAFRAWSQITEELDPEPEPRPRMFVRTRGGRRTS